MGPAHSVVTCYLGFCAVTAVADTFQSKGRVGTIVTSEDRSTVAICSGTGGKPLVWCSLRSNSGFVRPFNAYDALLLKKLLKKIPKKLTRVPLQPKRLIA